MAKLASPKRLIGGLDGWFGDLNPSLILADGNEKGCTTDQSS